MIRLTSTWRSSPTSGHLLMGVVCRSTTMDLIAILFFSSPRTESSKESTLKVIGHVVRGSSQATAVSYARPDATSSSAMSRYLKTESACLGGPYEIDRVHGRIERVVDLAGAR
jgi:hypothetical protein